MGIDRDFDNLLEKNNMSSIGNENVQINYDPQLERSMIDLIRSIMYSCEDGINDANNDGSLMIALVQELAFQLSEYDGVPCSELENRLLLALKALKRKKPKCFRRIERINQY